MAEMGIVLRPSEESKKRKGKGKAREMPAGHVVFVDGREECEFFRSLVSADGWRELTSIVEHFDDSISETVVAPVEMEEAPDLGWEVAGPRRKKKDLATVEKAPVPIDEEAVQEEARVCQLVDNLVAYTVG